MLTSTIKDNIRAYLHESIDDSDRNIYFNQYHSSKNLGVEIIEQLVSDTLGVEDYREPSRIEEKGIIVRINESPILIWEIPHERWLFVFSSSLNRRLRDKLSNLPKKVGWILEVWMKSDIVDQLYREFSPDEESVNIERTWDPYYVYERGSDVPENLQEYFESHMNKFVEQEIEFNLKTPKWMVDEALQEGVKQDLLNKSEITQSRFTFKSPDDALRQDGGVEAETPSSSVTVRQGGQVVHRSGNADATFDLLEELETKTDLFKEFSKVLPEREYKEHDQGIIDLSEYQPGRVLEVVFDAKSFDEEASITLSNLLTVGQSDVDLHGVIKRRGDLWFLSETYAPYDNGEYEILFAEKENSASVYIRPISGSLPSLVYIYRKLKEKFDSRTSHNVVDDFPLQRVI